MNAQLVLYYHSKILESENFLVERVEDYLSNLSKILFNAVQLYDASKMDISIKIKADSENDNALKVINNDYNYAKVTIHTKTLYYFVRKISYVAPMTYQVDLHLDVLNSYYNSAAAGFSPLTHITRQHKDRFQYIQSYSYRGYMTHIDEYSEGITPKLFKSGGNTLYGRDAPERSRLQDCYLLYLTTTDGVKCAFMLKQNIFNVSYDSSIISCMGFDDSFYLRDSRVVKIIKLPYLPTHGFSWTDSMGGYLLYDTSIWEVWEDPEHSGYHLLTLKSSKISTTFENEEVIQDTFAPRKNMDLLYQVGDSRISLSDMRPTNIDEEIEPKLDHSDFHSIKYVYDSFVKVIKPEVYFNYLSGNPEATININFTMTKSINSRFMFTFDIAPYNDFSDEDFENYLLIARNNEEVIYNEPYINYIRSGFNYDVKNKNRQEVYSWFTTGITMAAGITSVAVGSKTLGIGLIASSVLGIGASINNTIQLETNMQEKLNQLKMQSAAVYGADDVDLMSIYCQNKLKRIEYKVSKRMQKNLLDLFYYTGYIDDVNEIPNLDTRMWFNFVQCEIQFKYCPCMNKEQLDEFKGKFLGGVTKLHANTINGTLRWDFERVRENWERVFFTNN